MRTLSAIQLMVLLTVSAGSMAAKVEYQHPDVTIVAVDETLDSVLRAVSKAMDITVTVPAGINPVINCDIQHQPIKRAFKTLLGELSYSLVWEEGSERVAGVVILSGTDEVAVAAASKNPSTGVVNQLVDVPVESRTSPTAAAAANDDGPGVTEYESRLEDERLGREARMAEERAEEEVRMAQRRQEDELVHQERMKAEVVRHEAWMSEYLQDQGLSPVE